MRRLASSIAIALSLTVVATAEDASAPPSAPPAPAAPSLPPQEWATLVECARECGLPDGEAGRCVAVDLDGDGHADVVTGAGKRVFRNLGGEEGPSFSDVTGDSGLAPADGKRGADVLAWGDVNGDGFVDC